MQKLLIISLLLLLSFPADAREEKKVYKWTDAEGNVHFSDSIPAQYAERPKEVLNDQGVAVESLEGKKTEEQLTREAEQEKIRVAKELQRRADMMLLNTYLSIEEIMMHRDRRVELFQAQRKVTELYLKNLERRHLELRDEASRYQPYADDPQAPMITEDLAADIRQTRDTIARHERNLEQYEAEENRIIQDFKGDIERFKILKGIKDTPVNAVGDSPRSGYSEPEQAASTSP
jgi:hypothetical protein